MKTGGQPGNARAVGLRRRPDPRSAGRVAGGGLIGGPARDLARIVVVAQAAGPGPGAWTAGLLALLGAALFGVSALLLKTGAVGWDESLFRMLNQVPAAAASVLTPLSHLFLPAGIIAVVALAVVYVVARNRSVLPVATGERLPAPDG